MSAELSDYDLYECKNRLTPRDVTRHADLWAADTNSDNHALVAHLEGFAGLLMQASYALVLQFLDNSGDHTPADATQGEGLDLLTRASTCAYNADLFVQEAHHRTAVDRNPITD
ncbi:hypothetical protein [Krasilnikovia sp. M28-CT-15]|uniref:hypothetical protein n=1 Tax=Krasilnikovia sp. M28-CT-15 TaxID=3373540 RepID=UPI00387652AF